MLHQVIIKIINEVVYIVKNVVNTGSSHRNIVSDSSHD